MFAKRVFEVDGGDRRQTEAFEFCARQLESPFLHSVNKLQIENLLTCIFNINLIPAVRESARSEASEALSPQSTLRSPHPVASPTAIPASGTARYNRVWASSN